MDKRNHTIHGNVDPEREQIETVYFKGKVPLFKEPGDNIGKFFETLERQYQPENVIKEYEEVYVFLQYIVDCLEPEMRDGFWRIMEDRYPGYEIDRKITGALFPEQLVSSYLPGLKYDDELQVTWP